jgi:2'-5' RNA ligase
MRLFLAIYPPKEFRDYFRDVMREFSKEKRNLRIVPIDQVHLTLKFIGADVGENSRKKIVNELRRKQGSFSKSQISLTKLTLGFPRQNNPNIILHLVKNNSDLKELANQVNDSVKHAGNTDTITWKDRFTPHFTLARMKKSASKSEGDRVEEVIRSISITKPESFFPKEFVLVQGILSNTGVSYRKLENFRI